MSTKTKCVWLLFGSMLIAKEALTPYFPFKGYGYQEIGGKVKKDLVKETVESSSEKTKDVVLEETFRRTIRKGNNSNYKMGNLLFRKHVSN